MPTSTQMCRDFFLWVRSFCCVESVSCAIIGSASDLWHLSIASISLRPKKLTHRRGSGSRCNECSSIDSLTRVSGMWKVIALVCSCLMNILIGCITTSRAILISASSFVSQYAHFSHSQSLIARTNTKFLDDDNNSRDRASQEVPTKALMGSLRYSMNAEQKQNQKEFFAGTLSWNVCNCSETARNSKW